ncbi:MAG: anti-sigma factor antagonist [Frankiaceae bacterium]|jgi:anti-anti-sigma factor|nr:anti-sigma factor antagonist [Frankiaceae bacterium]
MSTMAVLARSSADATFTADGMFVRIAGELDSQSLSQLRSSLLRTRPSVCRDVIVDAGAVTFVDDSALAVLVAASAWAADSGATISYSRMSDALRAEVETLGLQAALPMLAPIGARNQS